MLTRNGSLNRFSIGSPLPLPHPHAPPYAPVSAQTLANIAPRLIRWWSNPLLAYTFAILALCFTLNCAQLRSRSTLRNFGFAPVHITRTFTPHSHPSASLHSALLAQLPTQVHSTSDPVPFPFAAQDAPHPTSGLTSSSTSSPLQVRSFQLNIHSSSTSWLLSTIKTLHVPVSNPIQCCWSFILTAT